MKGPAILAMEENGTTLARASLMSLAAKVVQAHRWRAQY